LSGERIRQAVLKRVSGLFQELRKQWHNPLPSAPEVTALYSRVSAN
jgi:hypothetical protein